MAGRSLCMPKKLGYAVLIGPTGQPFDNARSMPRARGDICTEMTHEREVRRAVRSRLLSPARDQISPSMTIMLDPNSVRTTMLRRFELVATIIWRQSPRGRRPYRVPAELTGTAGYMWEGSKSNTVTRGDSRRAVTAAVRGGACQPVPRPYGRSQKPSGSCDG
jgi:hypothetical protein